MFGQIISSVFRPRHARRSKFAGQPMVPAMESLEQRQLLSASGFSSFVSDPDDTTREAFPLGDANSLIAFKSGYISEATDVDMYSFEVTEPVTLEFTVRSNSSGFTPRFRLFGPSSFSNHTAPIEHYTRIAFGETTFRRTLSTSGTYYAGISELDNEFYNPVTGGSDLASPFARTGLYNLNIVSVVPDLNAKSISAPTNAASGESIRVTAEVNNGGLTRSGSYDVSFYLSHGSYIDRFDIHLKTVTRSALSDGRNDRFTETLTLPANLQDGNYHIGFIVDSGDSNTDPIRSNNDLSNPPRITITTPLIGSVAATVSEPTVRLTAGDVNSRTDIVQFFHDTDQNGRFDGRVDRFIGADVAATGGWALSTSTAGLHNGSNSFFARAKETGGRWSDAVSTVVNVDIDVPPPVGNQLTATPDAVAAGSPVRVAATFSDARVVQIFEDTNRNGRLDFGGDRLIGGGAGNEASTTHSPFANTTYFARAKRATTGRWDNSFVLRESIVVTGIVPVDSLTTSETTVTGGQSINVTAVFADARVVQLFEDVNGNGRLDFGRGGDRLIGGGAGSQATTSVNPNANTTYLARAKRDSTGRWDNANVLVSEEVVVSGGITPTITATPNAVDAGQRVAVTAVFADARVVQLFEDVNGNGRLDFGSGGDRLIGGGGGHQATASHRPDSTTTYLARAKRNSTGRWDNLNVLSTAVTVTPAVTPATPSILTRLSAPGSVVHPHGTLQLEAHVSDNSKVSSVNFYRDANGNGRLDSGDESLGRLSNPTSGRWRFLKFSGFYPSGTNRFFAQANLTSGGQSEVATATSNLVAVR